MDLSNEPLLAYAAFMGTPPNVLRAERARLTLDGLEWPPRGLLVSANRVGAQAACELARALRE